MTTEEMKPFEQELDEHGKLIIDLLDKSLDTLAEKLLAEHAARIRNALCGNNPTGAFDIDASSKEVLDEYNATAKLMGDVVMEHVQSIVKQGKEVMDAVRERYEKLDERSKALPGWKEIGKDIEAAERAEGK